MQMRDTHTTHHTPATVQRPPKLGRLTSLIGLRAFKALSDGPIRPKLHSYSSLIHTGPKATLGRPQTSKTHQQSPSSGSRHGPAKPNQTRAAHSVLTDAARLTPHILTKNKNPRERPPRIPGHCTRTQKHISGPPIAPRSSSGHKRLTHPASPPAQVQSPSRPSNGGFPDAPATPSECVLARGDAGAVLDRVELVHLHADRAEGGARRAS